MSYLDDRTVMSDSEMACNSSTDAVFIINNSLNYNGAPILGQTACARLISPGSQYCDASWVVINDAEHWRITSVCHGDPDQLTFNYVLSVRHELGHTVGLAHTGAVGPTCGPPYNGTDTMISDWVTSGTTLSLLAYNDHHKAHIDGFY